MIFSSQGVARRRKIEMFSSVRVSWVECKRLENGLAWKCLAHTHRERERGYRFQWLFATTNAIGPIWLLKLERIQSITEIYAQQRSKKAVANLLKPCSAALLLSPQSFCLKMSLEGVFSLFSSSPLNCSCVWWSHQRQWQMAILGCCSASGLPLAWPRTPTPEWLFRTLPSRCQWRLCQSGGKVLWPSKVVWRRVKLFSGLKMVLESVGIKYFRRILREPWTIINLRPLPSSQDRICLEIVAWQGINNPISFLLSAKLAFLTSNIS